MKIRSVFEKNSHVVYFTSYDENFFCFDKDKGIIRMPDDLYAEINDNLFAMEGLRICDCSDAFLILESTEEKYTCTNLKSDKLVFVIGG